jgi:hypothetical protein
MSIMIILSNAFFVKKYMTPAFIKKDDKIIF